MFSLTKIFFLSVAFAFSAMVYCQHETIKLDAITVANGLSQNSVTCVFQDSKGFLWVGTESGLNRYDGNGFKVFKNEPLDPRSISSNYVTSIAEDNNSNLWIATDYGLNFYDRNTAAFRTFFSDERSALSLSDNYIYSVTVDGEGYVWAKTIRHLDRIDLTRKQVISYEHDFDLFNPLADKAFFPVKQDSRGILWMGTNDGLHYFDPQYEDFKGFLHKEGDKTTLSNNQVRCIYEDSQSRMWIGTSDGLNLFDLKTRKFTSYYWKAEGNNAVTSISEDINGGLWLGTIGDGLLKFNVDFESFSDFRHNPLDVNSVLSDDIYALQKDRSDILWIGTRNGLNKLDIKKKKFKLYKNTPSSPFPFISNNITAIWEDENQHIWLGSERKGLLVFDPVHNASRIVKEVNGEKMMRLAVNGIFQKSVSEVLIATDQGVYVTSGSGRIESFFKHMKCAGCEKLKNIAINAIFCDSQKRTWFGTKQGLFYYDEPNKKFASFYHDYNDISTISSNRVNVIYEDLNSNIWIGTDKGLNRFEEGAEIFERKMYEKNSAYGLSHNSVYSIIEDANGFLWVGTRSGLNRYDHNTGFFHFYTEKNGLPNNQISAMVADGDYVWISTHRGLARIDINTSDIRSFDIADGLQGYEFNINAVYKNKNGVIYFGGTDGFNSFEPDKILDNQILPNVVINSVNVFGNEGKFSYNIGNKKQLKLPYNRQTFTIDFAALEFTMPSQNVFKYKMEGLDDDWIDIENRNFANFSNVPSGTYVFKVKGANNDRVWSPDYAELKIIIATPFWRNIYAYIVYCLLLVAVILLYIEYRTRTLKKSNRVLRDKQQAALEIERKSAELALKNKNITDSINYAKRIQWAIMPPVSKFFRLIPESFILYRPKDIVSGDFYWITEIGSKIFIAAVDCTGHGVPGAFMSIIGFDLLRNITKERHVHKPSEILDNLNVRIIELLTKNSGSDEVKDGMDISICAYNRDSGILEFSGAKNPLYLIRDRKINIIKADRFSVGLGNERPDDKFTNHEIKLERGDKVYLFSDGYADQFGGPKGEKLKYRRFRHIMLRASKLSFDEQVILFEEQLDMWMANHEQVDDILLLGMNFDNYLKEE